MLTFRSPACGVGCFWILWCVVSVERLFESGDADISFRHVSYVNYDNFDRACE